MVKLVLYAFFIARAAQERDFCIFPFHLGCELIISPPQKQRPPEKRPEKKERANYKARDLIASQL